MKTKLGYILIIFSVIAVVFFLKVPVGHHPCNPYGAGEITNRVGSGIAVLLDPPQDVCQAQYINVNGQRGIIEAGIQDRIIPVDFLFLSFVIGLFGIWILIRNKKSPKAAFPNPHE